MELREQEEKKIMIVFQKIHVRTSLKLPIISLDSSMSLNIPSSLLVKLGPHSTSEGGETQTHGHTQPPSPPH